MSHIPTGTYTIVDDNTGLFATALSPGQPVQVLTKNEQLSQQVSLAFHIS